jgi:hypothetical protein
MATVRHLGLFPFCIANEFPDDLGGLPIEKIFPIGVELERLIKWFWRVKKWKAVYTLDDFTHEVIFWNNSVSTFVVNTGGGLNYFDTLNPETEKDLVCKSYTRFAEYFESDSGFSFSLFGFVLHASLQPQPAVVRQGDLYYPRFSCELLAGIQYISTVGITEDDTPIDIDLDGITVPAFIGNAVSGSLSISIHEYWPYDPEDGDGPIYDSTTGAQLREF